MSPLKLALLGIVCIIDGRIAAGDLTPNANDAALAGQPQALTRALSFPNRSSNLPSGLPNRPAAGSSETNGIKCSVILKRWQEGAVTMPMLVVDLANETTNDFYALKATPEISFEIKMFDSAGRQLKKTELGNKFGQPLTQHVISEWFTPLQRRWGMGSPVIFWVPSNCIEQWHRFPVVDMFQITEPGVYFIQLRARLIQASLDASGAPRKSLFGGQFFEKDKSGQYSFEVTELPEVEMKIEVQAEDVRRKGFP